MVNIKPDKTGGLTEALALPKKRKGSIYFDVGLWRLVNSLAMRVALLYRGSI